MPQKEMSKRKVYLLQVRLPIHQIGPHLCCLSSNDVGGHCSIYSPADIHPIVVWYENTCLLKPNLASTKTRSFVPVEEFQLHPNIKYEERVKVRAGFDVKLFVVVFIKTSEITWHCMPVNTVCVQFVKGKKNTISQILIIEGRVTNFKWSSGVFIYEQITRLTGWSASRSC